MIKQTNQTAVVVGASLAGLLVARVLVDHFDQVTLLERDVFPAAGANRKGVPQGQHIHVLLERGRRIMEKYLPGLTADLNRQGVANIVDVGLSVRWFSNGAYLQPGKSGLSSVGVARPTLESTIRRHVLALPNVQALEDHDVIGLVTNADKTRVTGVRAIDRRADRVEKTLKADLVIDAGGRGSRGPAWLEELGYERPSEETVAIGFSYTTCYYRRQPDRPASIKGIACAPAPPHKRLGIMLAQDGNRWVVTQGAYLGDQVSTDYREFLEAVRQLPTPDIYNVIKNAEPLGKPVTNKFPSNLRRHYERLTRFPQDYVVIGDALCSFNPIYGQGMTVAALETEAFEEWLITDREQLARRFFAKASQIIDGSWNAAISNDLRYSEVEGPRPLPRRFLNWYLGKVLRAAHHDAQVTIAFLKVTNMIAPPPSLLQPRIVWRVLKGNLRSGERDIGARQAVMER